MSGPAAIMSQDTRVAAGPPLEAAGRDRFGQRLTALALLATVIVLDQATKWWAWRLVSRAEINSGGDLLVGHTVGGWYANPVTGALLDLLDFGLLGIAISILVRRRRPAAVVVCGALMLGGWASNLLDRLGMHYWTAPGSVRGAIDFIQIGRGDYNVADFFIIGFMPLFLLVVGYLGWRATRRPATARAATRATRIRLRALRARPSMLALAGAGLIVVAATVGATNYGGVFAGPAHVSVQA